jgi:hypothetical protein
MDIIKRKSINLNHIKDIKSIQFIVSGQGVFLFSTNNESCSFRLLNKSDNDGFEVTFNQKHVLVNRIGLLEPLMDKNNTMGLIPTKGAYYWFSIDSQNGRFYAGIGEARIETKIYEYTYKFENDELRKANKLFLESIHHITLKEDIVPIRLLRDPITTSIPLIIKTTHQITMNTLASGLHMSKANLSITSQKLFECIAGERFVLNDDDFPDFSKAIEYSIVNPDGWCYKTLQKKSSEFSKNKPNLEETYLRITLGQNNGESPGIPYVMEIWPPKHYSPIHNHANAEAIIRVLHGEINVSLFPFLGSDKPFGTVAFEKDEITWISPNLNQTHQLHNLNSDTTCVTIQCYMYDGEDISHYDYFDYIDNNGIVQQYEPDLDMDFIEFKQLMKQEWNSRQQTKSNLFCCFT